MMLQSLMRADDVEFARPVHRVIDGRVLGDRVEARLQFRGPRHAAQMAVVEHAHRRVVFVALGGAGGLVAQQRRLHLGRQRGAQAVGFLTHSAIDAGELAITSARSPAGCRTACSAASMPPQLWPSR